jgi:RHS repeat-associated protein
VIPPWLHAVSRCARNCQAAPQVRPTTDAAGEAVFTLPVGDYRFRADKGGSQYWSGNPAEPGNHCTLPGCVTVTVTVPAGAAGAPGYPDGGPRLVFLASDPAVALLATLPLAAMGVLKGRRKKRLTVDEDRRTWAETAVLVVALGVGLVGVGMALAAPSQIALADGVPPVVTRTIDYTYDPLYRLVDATYSTGEQYTYTYDAVGNRLSYSGPDGTHAYTCDAADRLTSVDGVAYTYDNNGNLLSDGARTFTYDSANRLTQVVSGTLTTQYGYSGDGVRLMQTVNGVTTRYVNDVVAALPQVLQENRGGVAPTQVAYLYGQGMVAQQGSGTWAYQHPDALGSVRQLTDDAGNVTQARFYTPFGAPEAAYGQALTTGSFGYAGEQEDPASGLTYLRARYYDPSVGRFLTRDPYPAYASMPSTLHRYAYVGNNPINRVDPSGLRWTVPQAQQLRRNPLEMAGLSRVRAMNAGARSADRIGSPTRGARLSYRPGMALGGGLSRAGFGGYHTSGARMFPKPNAPPYDATQAARRYRDAANAITADAQRRGLGKRPSDCALDWYEAQREKQAVADAMAEGYGSMTASERKAARQKLQEQYQKLDERWMRHLGGSSGSGQFSLKRLWEGVKKGGIITELAKAGIREARTNPLWNRTIAPEEGLKYALMAAGVAAALVVTGGAAAVPIAIGAGVGAAIGYGAQVHRNLQQDMSLGDALMTRIDPLGIVYAGVQGAFSGAVAAMVEPLMPGVGSGLLRVAMTGATEFVSGRATQIALNLVSGKRWDANVWNPQDPQWQLDVLLDVVPGMAAGAWGAFRAARAARQADVPSMGRVDDAAGAGRYADELTSRARQSDMSPTLRQLDPEQRTAGKALLEKRLREIGPRMGIDDPYDLVDEVVFHERWTNPEFAVGPGNTRVIRAGTSFLERTEAGQLISAAHELDHAQRWDDLVRASGGDWEYAAAIHRSAKGTALESLEEVTAELRALNTVREHLGDIDSPTLRDSLDYINRNARDAVARAWSGVGGSGAAGRRRLLPAGEPVSLANQPGRLLASGESEVAGEGGTRPYWDPTGGRYGEGRWRDPQTGYFTGRPTPVQIVVDENGVAIPQYESGSYWRAAMVTEEIDATIGRRGWESGFERGVIPRSEADRTKLPPDAPFEERVIEYVGVEGARGFPRDSTIVGVHSDPFQSIEVALGTGAVRLEQPGWYMRLDELHLSPEGLLDVTDLFRRRGLRSKFSTEFEYAHDKGIPWNRVLNTVRWKPGVE